MAVRPKASASLHEVNGKSATPGRANGNQNPGFADHPPVGEVRGLGLLCAIELVAARKARSFYPDPATVGTHCRNTCFASGLIMHAIRDTAPRPSSSAKPRSTNSSPRPRTRSTARRRIPARCEGCGTVSEKEVVPLIA
jgi:hypothetical protein